MHPERERHYESHNQEAHFPFVVYVLCNQLKTGMGNALIDTGSQVSLVAETGLVWGLKIRKPLVQIHDITSNVMETKGQIDLCRGNFCS